MNWYSTEGISEFDVGAATAAVPALAARIQAKPSLARPVPMVPVYGQPRALRQVVRPLPFPVTAAATFVNGGAVVANLVATYNDDAPAVVRNIFLSRANVGAASPGLAVWVTQIRVGSTDLYSAVGGIPVERFAPGAQQPLELPLAGIRGGMSVTVSLQISAAPAQNETVWIYGNCDLAVAG